MAIEYSLHQQKLFNFFDSLYIKHETFHHQPLFTCDDRPLVALPAPETKNLFLRDDKKRFWLISALQGTVIDLKALSKKLDAKGLRFAQPELLKQYLALEPGSVTWFGLINDVERIVHPILDAEVLKNKLAGFHPLKNDATTVISAKDLLIFAKALGYEPHIIDFGELILFESRLSI